MATELPRNTREQKSQNLAQQGRRRTKRFSYINAGKPQRDRSLASEIYWPAIEILEDNGTHYRIRWDGTDPATGSRYEPTWELHEFVTSDLEEEWKETIAAQSAVAGHTESHREASHLARYRSASPKPRAPVQSPKESVLQTRQVPLVCHARTSMGKELFRSALFATKKPLGVEEQQGTHNDLVAQVVAPARDAIDRQSELVLRAETPSKTDCEGSTLIPPSVDTIEKHHEVLLAVKEPLGRLKEQEAYKFATRHTSPFRNVGKVFDDTTNVETYSERLISSPPQNSGLTEQHIEECPTDLYVSSLDGMRNEPSVTLPRRTMIVRSKSTGEQIFADHIPTHLRKSKSGGKTQLLSAEDQTKRVPHIPEQLSPPRNDGGRRPPPLASYEHVQFQGATPVRKAQGYIQGSVHTTYDNPTAPTSPNKVARKPLSSGDTDSTSMSRQREKSVDISSNNSGRMQSASNELVHYNINGPHKTHPGDNQRPQQHEICAIEPYHTITTPIPPLPRADIFTRPINVSNSVERANTTELMQADVQVEAKKKRKLMSRTKTGCKTCRKRKKKCDEARPQCKNCERGGFDCNSDVNTKPWLDNMVANPLLFLQAPTQVPIVTSKHNSRFHGSDLPHLLNSEPGIDNSRGPYPSIESAGGLPPVRYLQPLPASTLGRNRNVSHKHYQVAHFALPPRPQKTQKLKMLDGEPFLPYDVELVDERAKCAGTVHRLNITGDAKDGMVGITQGALQEIVQAKWIQPRCKENPVGGYLGVSVHVATPFHCDYGYNISIADNVIIGPDCQLLDSARITIGKDTKIGARVTITTLETPTGPKALKGSCGTEVAREISIGANVYIGDRCIIGAGVSIGNGAIIGSGSVVVHNILPGCIAHGNPADMYKAYPIP